MKKIKEFLKREYAYSNLSMIIRNVFWALFGAFIWNLFNF